MDLTSFETQGYTVLDFQKDRYLLELQELLKKQFPCHPVEWHTQRDVTPDQHTAHVKNVLDKVIESSFVTSLIADNKAIFVEIVGPDFDLQVAPHIRVTRPEVEGDMVDWHRDSFYGSTPWELNIWFPVFPLAEGAGLRVLPGSHVMPSKNIRDIAQSDEFRKAVQKGSTAHQIGHVYAAKTDDTLSAMKVEDTALLTPKCGSFVLFFGCAIHRAQNRSNKTRISVDTRLKNSFAPTNTRAGYYKSLSTSCVTRAVQRFQGGC